MDHYSNITGGGSDTDKPLNVGRRLEIIRAHLDVDSCQLLDCGCGTGGYLAALNAVKGIKAHGLEYEQDKYNQALERGIPESSITLGDIQDLPFESESFDAVLLNEVLEHVPDHDEGLQEVYRVLRPGGVILVFSPNRCYPFETHGAYLKRSRKVVKHYVPFIPWIPLAVGKKFLDYPARNYWPRELRALLESHGFVFQGKDFVWQTFENISGIQPAWMKPVNKLLRKVSFMLEGIPLIRVMGVSQFLAMKKP